MDGAPTPAAIAWQYEVSWKAASVFYLRDLLQSRQNDARKGAFGAIALADSFSFDLHARLSTILLSHSIDSSLLLASFHDGFADFMMRGSLDPGVSRSLTDKLSYPLLVTSDSCGRITRIQLDSSTSILYQDFIRGLFSLLQFHIPIGTARIGQEMSQEEFNTKGKYIARYRVEAKSGTCGEGSREDGVISVRKIRERLKTPRRSPICGDLTIATKIKTTGDILACVDTIRHCVVSLHGEIHEDVRIGTRPASQSTSIISAKLIGRTPIETDTLSVLRQRAEELLASGASRRLFEEKEPPTINLTEDTVGLAGIDEATLLRQIDSVDTQPDSARMAGVARAARLLAVKDHSFCGRLAEKVSRNNTSARLLQMASGVLAELNVEEAHLALIALLRFYAGSFQRYLAIMPAIGRIRNPSAQVESTLWSLADSGEPRERSAAEAALGILAHCMSREAPERRESIARRLSDRLKSAENEQRKCDLISVLGNTATTEALIVVSRHLTDSSVQVRRASASALRWAPDTRADTLLAVMLLNDESKLVRQGAIDALVWREAEPVAVQAELQVAVHDADPTVRSKILRHLDSVRQDFPEVEQVIKQVAKSDSSEEVRKLAQEMLKHM
jgi:hypothetical protein